MIFRRLTGSGARQAGKPFIPTIALVEDDRNLSRSASIALEAEGYRINTYTDSASALDGFKTAPPDLVILDVKMPSMDGMETLRRLRQKSDLPVIFLTSKDEEIDELFGLKMGADDFIRKPFSQGLLLKRVKALLRRASSARKNEPVTAADEPRVTTKGYASARPLDQLLARWTPSHDDVYDLCQSLVSEFDGIARDTCRYAGLDISNWSYPRVLCEPRFDRARSQLSNLMTEVRSNHVAMIAKNNRVENAVVLLDLQAAELLFRLARMALESEQRFGDFERTETFNQEEAEQLAQLEIHKPLSVRQSVVERRAALRAFAAEADGVNWEAPEKTAQGQASTGQASAEG